MGLKIWNRRSRFLLNIFFRIKIQNWRFSKNLNFVLGCLPKPTRHWNIFSQRCRTFCQSWSRIHRGDHWSIRKNCEFVPNRNVPTSRCDPSEYFTSIGWHDRSFWDHKRLFNQRCSRQTTLGHRSGWPQRECHIVRIQIKFVTIHRRGSCWRKIWRTKFSGT